MIRDASALPPDIPYSKPAPTTSPPSPPPPLLCGEEKTGVDDDGPPITSLASKNAPVSKVEDAPAHTVEGVSWVLRVGTVVGSQNGQSDTARENFRVPADTWWGAGNERGAGEKRGGGGDSSGTRAGEGGVDHASSFQGSEDLTVVLLRCT